MIKIFTVLFLALVANFAGACGMPAGGRSGLHGMVLYGSEGQYAFDHIPMVHAPHDLQILTKVRLLNADKQPIHQDYASHAYTFKPSSNFSLNDYANGSLQQFSGAIYFGNFEQGGKLIADNVQVIVESIVLARKIPGATQKQSQMLEIGNNAFEVNLISPENNFQFVKNTKTGQTLWCVKGPDFFENCD